MTLILQPGLFSKQDDTAIIDINGRWYRVPVWLWLYHQVPDGISELIQTWQDGILSRVYAPDIERPALYNIRADARALLRFYANPYAYKYNVNLGRLELQVLRLERKVLADCPHLKGRHIYQEIADRLNRINGYGVTPLQVKGILRDATDMLRIMEERERIRRYRRFVKAIADLDYSEMVVSQVA